MGIYSDLSKIEKGEENKHPKKEPVHSPAEEKIESIGRVQTYTHSYTLLDELKSETYKKRRIRRVSFNVFDDQYYALKKLAKRNDTAVSDIIRNTLDGILETQTKPQ